MTYIHREIEPALQDILHQFPAIALTGPRQTGKSTLLRKAFPDFKYCNLENVIDRQSALADPFLFLKRLGEPAIIDEIQYAPELTSTLKVLIDENRESRGRFILTGSQQFQLIRHLGDSLVGRIAIIELLPFSVGEKKGLFKSNGLGKPGSSLERFKHACLQGSFPELCAGAVTRKALWYSSYVRTYLERDARSFISAGSLIDFEKFLQLCAARTGQQLNMASLAHDLGLSVGTVKNWFSILEAARLIFFLPPYHSNAGKRIVKSPKMYFTDCGLACFLTGVGDEQHLLQGPMAGALFETFCVQETLKTCFNQLKQPRLYYLRTTNGIEVDLIIEGAGMTLYPVEIKMNATPRTNMADNIAHFRKTFVKLNVEKGRLLTLADRDEALTKDADLVSLGGYLDWLKTVII